MGARGGSSWTALVLACAAEFMVVLDASVVNVAVPSIQSGLGVGPLGLPWVVNGYALVFAGFLLLGGRLADLYGHRRVFLAGVVLFAGASAVGGCAPAPEVLIAARAVQALGAAVLAPVSLTIVTTTFTGGPRRVRALAVWAALASAGGAAGNLLGGVLTALLTWRATLLINVPLGAAAVVLAVRVLADGGGTRTTATDGPDGQAGRRLDVTGAVAATLGVAALTFAVTEAGPTGARTAVTAGAAVVGVVALGVFAVNEARLAPAPLVPVRLFLRRAIAVGNVTMLLAGACLMPMWYFLSLRMQQVLGYSALVTGLGFLPLAAVTVLAGAYAAPWLLARVSGRALVAAGALVAAAGFWWQSRAGAHDGYVAGLLGPTVVIAIGSGLLNTPLTAAVTAGVTRADAGAASGLMNTTKQLGGALGLAALAAAAAGAGTPAAGFTTAFTAMAVLMAAVAVLAAALPATASALDPRAGSRV